MRLHARIHGEPLPDGLAGATPIVARDPAGPVLVARDGDAYRVSIGLL
jgi:hypothetical protein